MPSLSVGVNTSLHIKCIVIFCVLPSTLATPDKSGLNFHDSNLRIYCLLTSISRAKLPFTRYKDGNDLFATLLALYVPVSISKQTDRKLFVVNNIALMQRNLLLVTELLYLRQFQKLKPSLLTNIRIFMSHGVKQSLHSHNPHN